MQTDPNLPEGENRKPSTTAILLTAAAITGTGLSGIWIAGSLLSISATSMMASGAGFTFLTGVGAALEAIADDRMPTPPTINIAGNGGGFPLAMRPTAS